MKHTYQFPDRQKRNAWLQLIDARVGPYGIGTGLELDGLRYVLESDKGSGRIKDLHCNAAGDWKISGNTVEIDWGFIAANRENFPRLADRLWECACQFGAGQYSPPASHGEIRIKW